MQFGDLTAIEASIFNIQPFDVRPHEFPDDIHLIISYEFDLDLYKIDRDTYNTLDWFGDIGGLYEALFLSLGFFYSLFHF